LPPPRLHPRNRNNAPYDLEALVKTLPSLAAHIVAKPGGGDRTINFQDPAAVRRLNEALMAHHYGISGWHFPEANLCPAVPGRADALHVIADLMARENGGRIPVGSGISGLDIGTGASLVYPLIGAVEYGWSFVATDIAPESLASAEAILAANPAWSEHISCLLQSEASSIFEGVMPEGTFFDFTMCNPPFHASAEEAAAGTRRKWQNLKASKVKPTALNFGGVARELVCSGGELGFIQRMIQESHGFGRRALWFTTLVAQQKHLPPLLHSLKQIGAAEVHTLPLNTGNKASRLLAWTFLDGQQREVWRAARWRPAKSGSTRQR
jgi:23S rRNA (adenine1618-N6)-methyltransferase